MGTSPAIASVIKEILRVSRFFETVLVTGPTGSGKELVARALHENSPVRSGPFVPCDAVTLNDSLIESELFGHVKGAFTGAARDKKGYVERARGGTLFLDEIGDVPLAIQVKLLRVVEYGQIPVVGLETMREVDCRFVFATRRNLRQMVEDGEFREDLYFRIATLAIPIPVLAERTGDIPLLIEHFLQRFAAKHGTSVPEISPAAMSLLLAYP